MKTQMLSAQRPEDIAAAAGLLRNGKLVAIPTETVYGLGANGLDENAVLRIFEAKGRPQDNPLILHISEPRELESICHDIPAQAWLLAEHFWPGPLTMVLPVREAHDGRAGYRRRPLPENGRDARAHPAGGRAHRRAVGQPLRQALDHDGGPRAA